MTSFSRALRAGVVPVPEAHRPNSERGQFVADKLRVLARAARDGFDGLVKEGFTSDGAKRRAAAALVANLEQTARRIGHEVDRLQREADEQASLVEGAIVALERNMTPLGVHRMAKRAEALKGMPEAQLRKLLDAATLTRDTDTLLAAWSENLPGAREAITRYAVGEQRARNAVELQRDALTLSQAYQIMAMGIEQMQNAPEQWVPESSGARPEERLSIANAGALAFIETQTAVRDRYETALQEIAAENLAKNAAPKQTKDKPTLKDAVPETEASA